MSDIAKKKTFYKTTYTFSVLSEDPVRNGMSLEDVLYECSEGDMVGAEESSVVENLTGKEMADALYSASSEPGFFGLDDDGNSTEED